MARLGRETQLHLDERQRHFQITDAVIIGISVVLIVLATFNVYYVKVLYTDLDTIVLSMESMLGSLRKVDDDMGTVAERVQSFDAHIAHMQSINAHMTSLSDDLPQMRQDMDLMAASMSMIDQDMRQLRIAVGSITPNMMNMARNMAVMRHNVHQIARPMGSMNPFLP
jgi:DNA repair ATPase RecN